MYYFLIKKDQLELSKKALNYYLDHYYPSNKNYDLTVLNDGDNHYKLKISFGNRKIDSCMELFTWYLDGYLKGADNINTEKTTESKLLDEVRKRFEYNVSYSINEKVKTIVDSINKALNDIGKDKKLYVIVDIGTNDKEIVEKVLLRYREEGFICINFGGANYISVGLPLDDKNHWLEEAESTIDKYIYFDE